MHQLELFPQDIRIERVDPDQNMHRFYRLHIQPNLFGGANLFREWGRIGTAGHLMAEQFDDDGQAADALVAFLRVKTRRGYRP
ncbi:WGR domain-containing protein [Jannaschia pagri]|uniref:WGR domain-containing protein n=1 Tax=Jannaschia pagri TaxID=2829797 RepID=A0ABQ4NS68_9RHOB|nr:MULTISPECIES: WGR domain-containing protein [unclassified Jannaschia]GIT93239.1 WGR domain-containing protein [Jannaschia sp. AI_61]GIT97094.1 WGR domain-containing protein [Jannaschia sp. AI_62]